MSISSFPSLIGTPLTSSIWSPASSTVKNSKAANSAATAAPTPSGSGVTNYDFTNITPLQLGNATQKLVQSGQLSQQQAALLRLSSEPLGFLGPQGQFEHFSAAQQATLDNTPVNAIQIAKDQISDLQSRGLTGDPEYGYQAWEQTLSTLQNLQGTPQSVNTTA